MNRLGATVERRWLWCLGLLVALAALPRAWALGADDLWFDEAFSALVAIAPHGGIVAEMSRDSSPPLYFLLLAGWERLWGPNPAALRSLSVACGLGSIALCGLLGRAWLGAPVGLGAALLLGLSPLHIVYSREARPYSLMVLWVLATILALEWWRRAPRSLGPPLAVCGLLAAAIYTHNFGLFLLPMTAGWAVLGWIPRRRAALCLAIVGVLYLPWAAVLFEQLDQRATAWLIGLWQRTPPQLAFVKSLAGFTIGGEAPPWIPLGQAYLPRSLHLTAYLTFGLAAASALRPGGERSRAIAALLIALGALLAVPHLVSLLAVPVLLVGRHDVVALAPFLLLTAYGLGRMRRLSRAVAIGIVGLLAAAALSALWLRPTIDTGRKQGKLLAAHAGSGDRVLCVGYTRNTLEYYTLYAGARPAFVSFPSSLGAHRGWLDAEELLDPATVRRHAESTVSALARGLADGSIVWLVRGAELERPRRILEDRLAESFDRILCPGNAEEVDFSCWRPRRRAD